ncbi:hypothetical protein FB561_2786 [Kribbella amoyensis]|uniref:Uncharacterized protein n=1 Tax=Kribbella amoyensis TaxID=996641 RepID=A0A561BS25_9ACTN|nr:hypothetical protein FB561_2786 [Kribbella amoyensis]
MSAGLSATHVGVADPDDLSVVEADPADPGAVLADPGVQDTGGPPGLDPHGWVDAVDGVG